MNRSLTLNKIVARGILGAFAMLMLELRYDHRNVLGEHWQSWIPLVYSGTMIMAGGGAVAFWERGGRTLLFWGFALALIVGSVGFWMHNQGEPQAGVERVLTVWTQPISAGHHHADHESASSEAAPSSASDEHDHAHDATAHDATAHDATAHDATAHDATAHDATAHDATAHDAAAHDAAAHDEAALQNPPVLAPLSFAGLGLLGMFACARRFGPRVER